MLRTASDVVPDRDVLDEVRSETITKSRVTDSPHNLHNLLQIPLIGGVETCEIVVGMMLNIKQSLDAPRSTTTLSDHADQ